jgi:endonuclease IV
MIGTHAHKGKHKTLAAAVEATGRQCVQIFTHGPRSRRMNNINIVALSKVKADIYVHEPYVLSKMWRGVEDDMDAMVEIMKTAQQIGALGVVIHIPREPAASIVSTLRIFIGKLDEQKIDTPILMEVPASRPTKNTTYETAQKMNMLLRAFKSAKFKGRVSICIDTAHLFTSLVPISKRADAIKYIDTIDKDWVGMLHLNGNAHPWGKTFNDKHAIPLSPDDHIWKDMSYVDSGCKEFVDMARSQDIPIIIEGKGRGEEAPFLAKVAAS